MRTRLATMQRSVLFGENQNSRAPLPSSCPYRFPDDYGVLLKVKQYVRAQCALIGFTCVVMIVIVSRPLDRRPGVLQTLRFQISRRRIYRIYWFRVRYVHVSVCVCRFFTQALFLDNTLKVLQIAVRVRIQLLNFYYTNY